MCCLFRPQVLSSMCPLVPRGESCASYRGLNALSESTTFSAETFSVLTPAITILMKPCRVTVPEYEETRQVLTKGSRYFEGRLLFFFLSF